MDDQVPSDKLRLCGAFMHAVQWGKLLASGWLVHGDTTKMSLENVAEAIVASGQESPITDSKGKKHTNHL